MARFILYVFLFLFFNLNINFDLFIFKLFRVRIFILFINKVSINIKKLKIIESASRFQDNLINPKIDVKID